MWPLSARAVCDCGINFHFRLSGVITGCDYTGTNPTGKSLLMVVNTCGACGNALRIMVL